MNTNYKESSQEDKDPRPEFWDGWSGWSDLYYPASFELDAIADCFEKKGSLLSDANLLEIGCGDGRVTKLLVDSCRSISGIDIEKKLISELAKIYSKNKTAQFMAMSGLELDFEPEQFDCILYCWSLHQMKPMLTTLKQAYRCLKKGGKLVVIALTKRGEYDNVVEHFGIDPGHHTESEQEHIRSIEQVFGKLEVSKAIGDDDNLFGFYFPDDDLLVKSWKWSLENWHGYSFTNDDQDKLLKFIERYRGLYPGKQGVFLKIYGNLLVATK